MTGFTTRLRTWVLIAALSGLLVAIGFLLGGSFIYLFLGIAVVMNLFGYFFSDKIALASSRAQPIAEAQAPELYADVRELTQRAGLPMPRIYMIPSEQPNAFATGRNPKHSAVAVTQGLLTLMPREQVKGVLAHELSHVKNHDILVSSIAAMIASVITWLSYMFFFFGGERQRVTLRGARGARGADHRAAGGDADPARHLAPARVPGRCERGQAARPGGAAGRRARVARAREQSPADAGQSGHGLPLHRPSAQARRDVIAVLDPPADR